MAVVLTNSGTKKFGRMRTTWGTFTSALGDVAVVVNRSVHGINRVIDADITLEPGGMGTPVAKITDSSSNITADFVDTMGYSGNWRITGHM